MTELGWQRHGLDAQRAFAQVVLARARRGDDWHHLPYAPSRGLALDAFGHFVEALTTSMVHDAGLVWRLVPATLRVRCPTHGVFEHAYGRVVCNDPFSLPR